MSNASGGAWLTWRRRSLGGTIRLPHPRDEGVVCLAATRDATALRHVVFAGTEQFMDGSSAKTIADVFAAFVDVLIPGDEVYPAASAVGTQGLLLDRVRQRLGHEAFPRVVDVLGESFACEGRAAQVEAVRRLERDEPDLFRFLRWATYFAYYERPPVIRVLRSLGHDYNDSPQPLGYPMSPFEPIRHLPATPRGSYKKTAEITRVDLTSLAGLGLPGQEV